MAYSNISGLQTHHASMALQHWEKMNAGALSNGLAEQNAVRPAPTPALTLVRAISRAAELNERLCQLRTALDEIANQIGGPRPVPNMGGKPGEPVSMIAALNGALDASHDHASELLSAVEAIRRALGG